MIKPSKFQIRLVLYGSIILYLLGDLLIFTGPLRKSINHSNLAVAGDRDLMVARVSGQPITRSQLDRAISGNLWLEGKTKTTLTPDEQATVRQIALDELIDQHLLRLQTKALAPQLKVTPEEIATRLQRLLGRFDSKAAMETAMKSQGISSEQDLRDRIAARIQQEKYVSLRIGPAIKVSDEEAREWFDENQKSMTLPERVEARHIFIPTLDHPPEKAKQTLDAALAELTEKKQDFATLAKELSGDSATREKGGLLGWMTRDRLPADFAAPVFDLEANTPTLVRTKLGWHLVEVTARKPAEPRPFDQAKPEIIAALEAVKRRESVSAIRKALRQAAADKIEIVP